MARIELAPEVLDDFERFVQHLLAHAVEQPGERIDEILQALQILQNNPQIGRPVRAGKRELVIGQGSRGYVALYRFVPASDIVYVLAVRSQREAGFQHALS